MALNLSSIIKENNGFCINADSNFASKKTCEDFYANFLRNLKLEPRIAEYVSAESSSSYETITLPMGLRNLGMISSEITSCRENYGDERAEFECRLYAAKFYPPGNEYKEFYDKYILNMINDVKLKFSGLNGSNPISVVSQSSFSRLSNVLVNLLLMKKPDGTNNLVRCRKAIPDSEFLDENQNISYSYYSQEEIEITEREAYEKENAHNFISLDMEYVPYSLDYLILTTASLITVKRTERNNQIELPTLDEILSIDGIDDPVLVEQLLELTAIAKRDFIIIDIIESRGNNIIDIIHADCKGTTPTQLSRSNLTVKEIYINILMYVRVILYMTIDLIEKVREYGENPTTTSKVINFILGIETTDDNKYNGFSNNFEKYFTDNDLLSMIQGLPFMFKINDHLFRILFINLVRRATSSVGNKGSSIVDKFASHISYSKDESSISKIIRNFIGSMDNELNTVEGSISDNIGIINTIKRIKEPIVSYAYRTAEKYLNRDSGIFGIELALIDSSIKIVESIQSGKKNTTSTIYNLFDNKFSFNLDSLIETVKKLSGIDSITEDTHPFKTYKSEIQRKIINLKKK